MSKRVISKEDAIMEMQEHYELMEEIINELLASWTIDMDSHKKDNALKMLGKIELLKKQQIEIQ